MLVRRAALGGTYTGAIGLDAYDQFQYLAWIRDSGVHGLIANPFGMIGGHVFLHPMYLISGLLRRLGIGLQLVYVLWAPIAAVVLWAGFAAYARRMEPAREGPRAAILVLALFFVTPLGWLSLPPTHWVAEMQFPMADTVAALQLWIALHTAIAIGLLPLVLLGCERLVARAPEPGSQAWRSRLAIATAVGAALVGWLHSWQGITLLIIIAGLIATRRPRRRDLALALPVLLCAAPLVYQFVLSKADPARRVAAQTNNRPDLVVATPVLAVLGPLLAAALLGAVRHRPRDDGERMLLLWPLAALAVYLFYPEFPPHALQANG